jgi:KDO2-lipid IV(A) lauroyltransferase
MGSFEVGMVGLLGRESRIHVVFKRDKFSLFERIRQDMRTRLGVLEAPIDEGWSVWMRLRDALANDEAIVAQGDRVLPGQKGIPVPFLGGHLLLPTGPIKLAIASGAPIIPIFTVRQPDARIRVCIEPAIEVEQAPDGADPTEWAILQVAAVLEKYVRTYPDQWLVLHKVFQEDAE